MVLTCTNCLVSFEVNSRGIDSDQISCPNCRKRCQALGEKPQRFREGEFVRAVSLRERNRSQRWPVRW